MNNKTKGFIVKAVLFILVVFGLTKILISYHIFSNFFDLFRLS